MTGALLARVGDKAPVLEVLGSDQAPVVHDPARRPIAPSFYGDLVAVATDTARRDFETQGKRAPRSIRLSGHPRGRAVLARRGTGSTSRRTTTSCWCSTASAASSSAAIDLPGPARGFAATASASGCWSGRPRATPPGSSTSARAGSPDRGRQVGRGPARRRLAQHPAGPARQGCRRARPRRRGLSRDRAREGRRRRRVAAGRVAPGAGRRERRPARFRALAARRQRPGPRRRSTCRSAARRTRPGRTSWPRSCGRPACPPRCWRRPRSDEAHRVVLGPYATREQAEETGRKIGMPSFVVAAQDAPDR